MQIYFIDEGGFQNNKRSSLCTASGKQSDGNGYRSPFRTKTSWHSIFVKSFRSEKRGSSEPPRDDCGTSQKPSWLAKPAASVRGERDEN